MAANARHRATARAGSWWRRTATRSPAAATGPGGAEEGIFHSYAYPTPPGFADQWVDPVAAYFDEQLGEFVLPYAAVRTAADPDAYLMDFPDSTFHAARDLASWPEVKTE